MKIQLPDFVIADLYKNALVVLDDATARKQPDEPEALPALYLGNNEKNIVILVNNPDQRFLDEESLQLLTNMLSALALALPDIALLNIYHTLLSYREIKAQFGAVICLLFDVPTKAIQLPFEMPGYKVQLFDDCKFLCSSSLQKMKGNSKEAKLEKTKLWMCLKGLFH